MTAVDPSRPRGTVAKSECAKSSCGCRGRGPLAGLHSGAADSGGATGGGSPPSRSYERAGSGPFTIASVPFTFSGLVEFRMAYFAFVPHVGGMSDDAARFRKQADEAREHASRAHSPLDKEAWLRVAEEWLKLAESAERQGPR